MVELQIVILAVAGSSPVGHPFAFQSEAMVRGLAYPLLNNDRMDNLPDFSGQFENGSSPTFWERIISDDELRDRANLEKLLAGCEIIAALDRVDLLAA